MELLSLSSFTFYSFLFSFPVSFFPLLPSLCYPSAGKRKKRRDIKRNINVLTTIVLSTNDDMSSRTFSTATPSFPN